MKFSEIIGHQDIKQRLIQSVAEQRIPHAQLICGSEGIGKLRLALAYAQYISCTNRSVSDSCGVCPSCVKCAKLIHPDLHFAFPIVKSSTGDVCNHYLPQFREMVLTNNYFGIDDWMAFCFGDNNKQSIIYENESDEIIKKLSLKSYESEYKVMIIWLPEKMHESCSNKILKILEEPAEKTLFLLVSNQPDLLLTTIASRTQRIQILPLTDDEVAQTLLAEKHFELSPEDAQNIARIASGSALMAARIASTNEEEEENTVNFERFTTLFRQAWMLGAGSIPQEKKQEALRVLRDWADALAPATVGRERQRKFLAYSQHLLRENFIMNLHQPALNYLTVTEENFAVSFSRFITERNIEPMMAEFALAERQIGQNSNAKIVFFDLALKMIMLLKNK
jgi:DNA polymerase-3 subunit delta'